MLALAIIFDWEIFFIFTALSLIPLTLFIILSQKQHNQKRNTEKKTPHQQIIEEELSLQNAYQVLGLKSGVSRKEVFNSHKKLMMVNHPDKGGSEYIAQLLNQARDKILSHLPD